MTVALDYCVARQQCRPQSYCSSPLYVPSSVMSGVLPDLESVIKCPLVVSRACQRQRACEWSSAYLIGSFPHELLCRHFPDGRNRDDPSHIVVVELTTCLIAQLLQEGRTLPAPRLQMWVWLSAKTIIPAVVCYHSSCFEKWVVLFMRSQNITCSSQQSAVF